MSEQPLFGFERMEVYQVARAALKIVIGYRAKLRGLPGEIASQLERAGVSTVANLAEAYGRVTPADQQHRYSIARAEARGADAMFSYWSKVVTDGLSGGFVAARVSGDVTWMLTALLRR